MRHLTVYRRFFTQSDCYKASATSRFAGQVDGKGDAKGKWLAEVKDNGSSTSYGWNYANNEYYPVNRSLGGGATHNNMPPYLAVYMWKRVS